MSSSSNQFPAIRRVSGNVPRIAAVTDKAMRMEALLLYNFLNEDDPKEVPEDLRNDGFGPLLASLRGKNLSKDMERFTELQRAVREEVLLKYPTTTATLELIQYTDYERKYVLFQNLIDMLTLTEAERVYCIPKRTQAHARERLLQNHREALAPLFVQGLLYLVMPRHCCQSMCGHGFGRAQTRKRNRRGKRCFSVSS